jgi:hypothetical protein
MVDRYIKHHLDGVGDLGSPMFAALERSGVKADDVLVADLAKTSAAEILAHPGFAEALRVGRPVLLRNPADAEAMARVTGIGTAARCVVFRPAVDNGVARLSIMSPPPNEPEILDALGGRVGEPPADGRATDPECLPEAGELPSTADDDAAVAAWAAQTLAVEKRGAGSVAISGLAIDPVPDGIPGRRVILDASPVTYHPTLYTWHHRDKPDVLKQQRATIALGLFLELYASSNPENKFMRLTTIGSGFNPGALTWNDSLERGAYQDFLQIAMTPSPIPSGFMLLDSQPKTENDAATYTISSNLSVGLKAGGSSKGGGSGEGSVSYSIGSSISTHLSAFKVMDHSDGAAATWNFEMSLCGNPPTGIYNVANPGGIIDLFGTVWDPVDLAKSTLFPACQSIWSAPLSFAGTLRLSFGRGQRLVYMASNRLTWYGHTAWRRSTVPLAVDFSSVSL